MRFHSILFFLFTTLLFSQSKEGYWDNVRTTNETFTLSSNKKKYIKTADFPEGTAELVYRITVLDDNQKVSGSLVSVLKAIPDPTGISQGAAGAVFLLSTISGEDKCKYAIFSSAEGAENYIKTGKTDKACFVQETPINKEAKLFSSNSKCITPGLRNLYFAFENDNWVMNEKITLEVVPWVNTKQSRGWNPDTKKEILAIATALDWTKNLSKKESFYASFIENIQKNYTYAEFRELLPVEKSKAIEQATEESLQKSGEKEKYFNAIRDKAYQLFVKNKTKEAIDLINTEMIAKNRASYKDYGALGDYHLLTKQFSKAESYYSQGLKLNPSEIQFQLNLAHVYLFTNRLSEAKKIHKKYHSESLSTGKSWTEQTKADFTDFEKRGFPNKDFKKILRILE